jgi:hypothetical protein
LSRRPCSTYLESNVELTPLYYEPSALRQFPLLSAPLLILLPLSMDFIWGTTRVESIFVEIAQRLGADLAIVVKKGVLELIETGGSGVSHDLKTSKQLDVTRRAPCAHRADALGLIAGSKLRPVPCDSILGGSFIGRARLLITVDDLGACSAFATLADVELRRAGCSRENSSADSSSKAAMNNGRWQCAAMTCGWT